MAAKVYEEDGKESLATEGAVRGAGRLRAGVGWRLTAMSLAKAASICCLLRCA